MTPAFLVGALLLATLSYYVGRARGIGSASRRWLVVVNEVERAWTVTAKYIHGAHVTSEQALLEALGRATQRIADLKDQLDRTAIPAERN